MTVLYRKYRPQTFSEVAGQEHVKATLLHQAATGRLAHAYLFTGPRGVGKTTMARLLAKAVGCRNAKDGEPCGECADCREIAEGRSLDVIELDAASNSGVETIREEIVDKVRLAPNRLPRKVYVIDEVHMLSTAAFNALLKTLEEPPAHVLFVLATTELHKVPVTVVSRCQRFDFRKIPRPELIARLRKLLDAEAAEADDAVLERVAAASEGCLRDAESLLSQLLSMGEKRLTLETAGLVLPSAVREDVEALSKAVIQRDAALALRVWEGAMARGTDPLRFTADLIDTFRASAMAALRGEAGAQAGLSPARAAAVIERLARLKEDMKRAEQPDLPMELFLLELAEVPARAAEPPSVPRPPIPPPAAGSETPSQSETKPEPAPASSVRSEEPVAVTESPDLARVRERWSDVLRRAQEQNHALPYMLGVGELMECADGILTLGFQYALYRDRLNERKYKDSFERALSEALGAQMRVKAVLVAQRADGLAEATPGIAVSDAAAKNLPDGFAELVKEFGGTVAG